MSLVPSLPVLDHDVSWNDEEKDVHMHSFGVILPTLQIKCQHSQNSFVQIRNDVVFVLL